MSFRFFSILPLPAKNNTLSGKNTTKNELRHKAATHFLTENAGDQSTMLFRFSDTVMGAAVAAFT